LNLNTKFQDHRYDSVVSASSHFFATVTYPYSPYSPDDDRPLLSTDDNSTAVIDVADPLPICHDREFRREKTSD